MQETNNITDLSIHLATSQVTQGEKIRLVVAQSIIDRLFISNCISIAEITDFIKNELTTTLNLTEQEAQALIKEYETTKAIIDDKLKIAKMKQALSHIQIAKNDKLTEMIRKDEIKKLSKELIDSEFISNQELLHYFIMRDLCNHFKLSYEEKKGVYKEIRKWMR